MNIPGNISAAILAGGKSSRFHEDKAAFIYKGKPLIKHVYDRISDLFPDIVIVGDTDYDFLDAPFLEDLIPGAGPLGGILTALYSARHSDVFITACDMPGISGDFISYMAQNKGRADLCIPAYENYYQPLHAIYSKSCIGPVKGLIDRGEMKVDLLVEMTNPRFISYDEITRFDEPENIFFNINSPEDVPVAQ